MSRSIDRAVEKQDFHLLAFVYMRDHVHLIVFPQSSMARVERLIYGIKRPFSTRVKRDLEEGRDPVLDQLIVQERPSKRSFRFWQEGPGYDRNLISPESVRQAIEYVHNNPVRKGVV
ncbi:MAG: transposase [Nitrospinota bacterium]